MAVAGSDVPAEPPRDARTVQVPPARLQRWLVGFVERHGDEVYAADDKMLYLRGADGAEAWIKIPFPPMPMPMPSLDSEVVERVVAHVAMTRRVGAVLVRRGGYGVGIFDGSSLIASKVGSSYVQGTTKAGGWSQQRYARRRKNQADAAFAEAAHHAVEILLPEQSRLDAIFCGGDHGAVAAVLADARLKPLLSLVQPRIIDVVDPRLRVLKAFPDQFLGVAIQLAP